MLLWQIQTPRPGTNQNAEPSVPINANFKIIALRDVDYADEGRLVHVLALLSLCRGKKHRVALQYNVLTCLCGAMPARMSLEFRATHSRSLSLESIFQRFAASVSLVVADAANLSLR